MDLLGRLAPHAVEDDGERAAVGELVRELGHLPLAVEQAGAYLAETVTLPGRYLRRLRDNPAQTLGRGSQDTDRLATVGQVWRLTVEHIAARSPLAVEALRVLAWLAPDGLPRDVLDGLAVDDDPEGDIDAALGMLAAYSMIRLSVADVRTHRLVQTVSRSPVDHDSQRRTELITASRGRALRLIERAAPESAFEPDKWPRWSALLPHIAALNRNGAADDEERPVEYATFLDRSGSAIVMLTQEPEATAYLGTALHMRLTHLGEAHPDTLRTLQNLAWANEWCGDRETALACHRKAAALAQRSYDPADEESLKARLGLTSAEVMLDTPPSDCLNRVEAVLRDAEASLGPDHWLTATALHNLGVFRLTVIDADESDESGAASVITDLERAVSVLGRVSGTGHPHTLAVESTLGAALVITGSPTRGVPLLRQNVAALAQIYGPRHMDVALAEVYLATGCLSLDEGEEGLALFDRAFPTVRHALRGQAGLKAMAISSTSARVMPASDRQ